MVNWPLIPWTRASTMGLDLIDRLRCSCPYPLPTVNPSWRTSTVVAMASGILAEGAWDRLPILADALQDADCDDEEILTHLRAAYRPRKCRCVTAEGKILKSCKICKGTGSLTHGLEWERVPMHADGKFPNRNGGCWEGTCWVVRAILQKEQKVVARYEQAATPRYAPVINPGSDVPNHRVWIVVPNTWVDGPEYAVEAVNGTDAESDFVDSKFGEHYRISDEDLKDYMTDPGEWSESPRPPEYSCAFSDSGHPYDSENILVFGREREGHPVVYVGPGLPYEGVSPVDYANARWECEVCGKHFCCPGSEQVCSPECLKKRDDLPEENDVPQVS